MLSGKNVDLNSKSRYDLIRLMSSKQHECNSIFCSLTYQVQIQYSCVRSSHHYKLVPALSADLLDYPHSPVAHHQHTSVCLERSPNHLSSAVCGTKETSKQSVKKETTQLFAFFGIRLVCGYVSRATEKCQSYVGKQFEETYS